VKEPVLKTSTLTVGDQWYMKLPSDNSKELVEVIIRDLTFMTVQLEILYEHNYKRLKPFLKRYDKKDVEFIEKVML